jgi:hypothetical protein
MSHFTLDEAVVRTPTWAPGRWITLADGRQWAFPPIPLEWKTRILVDGRADLQPRWSAELHAELIGLAMRPAPAPLMRFVHLFQAARRLLQENYWLATSDCEALLLINPENPILFKGTLAAISAGDGTALRITADLCNYLEPAIETIRRKRDGRPMEIQQGDAAH